MARQPVGLVLRMGMDDEEFVALLRELTRAERAGLLAKIATRLGMEEGRRALIAPGARWRPRDSDAEPVA